MGSQIELGHAMLTFIEPHPDGLIDPVPPEVWSYYGTTRYLDELCRAGQARVGVCSQPGGFGERPVRRCILTPCRRPRRFKPSSTPT
jgi:hypothetical protein